MLSSIIQNINYKKLTPHNLIFKLGKYQVMDHKISAIEIQGTIEVDKSNKLLLWFYN